MLYMDYCMTIDIVQCRNESMAVVQIQLTVYSIIPTYIRPHVYCATPVGHLND